ncbi:hypothetical protein BZM27_49795 [Paraburkholderia steynii]|uniref:Response regulatory domain-containing protein n=1 Tax=Paraburkholderia steynii TaxID=1245441 RepID=A0A4R0X0C2_9BURK|nr:hypothetical protein BZM27_49795 [Paraburkholderia steynii]
MTETEHPDLIVTDWMMPVVDGVAFCRRLKENRATASIPVVMLGAALPPLPAALTNPCGTRPAEKTDACEPSRVAVGPVH